MELDGQSLGGALLETEICVVGAGPAGLTLARAFAGGATDILVLESGGLGSEPALQVLNEGRMVGDPYAGLRVTRQRQVGGTANLWNTLVGQAAGAKYVPLDPADLTGIPELPWSGWPLPWSELERSYGEAQRMCGLGAFDYDGASRAGPDRRPLDLTGASLETRIYELGPARIFTEDHPEVLRRAPNVRLCHHATVYQLRPDRGRERVAEALVAGGDQTRFRVRADVFVLAAGAIENARILLLSAAGADQAWLEGTSDWVGRCFMEHPRDHALTLAPREALFDEAGFYDSHVAPDGAHVLGRLGLAEELRRRERLPNVSVTLVPRLRRRLRMPWRSGRYPPAGTHWSERHVVPGESPAGASRAARRHDAFNLLLNLEQSPQRENRVVLGARSDRLGLSVPEVHWRWREEDQLGLERVRGAVAREFEACGLGRVEIAARRPNPNAHHHAGTTRMSIDAGSGVVDPTGRVHGIANLYACGASVFPTAGFANPTLTIVALALRMAEHLGADAPLVRHGEMTKDARPADRR
jgi:choline dehydrogenase-like flavoprotein